MRDGRRDFPSLDHPEQVVTARIWHCKYKTLAPLSALMNLEGLAIATYPDYSLEPLRALRKLRYLSVVHLPAVSDLDRLEDLNSLEVLSLSTLPSWGCISQADESPFADTDHSLAAIASC